MGGSKGGGGSSTGKVKLPYYIDWYHSAWLFSSFGDADFQRTEHYSGADVRSDIEVARLANPFKKAQDVNPATDVHNAGYTLATGLNTYDPTAYMDDVARAFKRFDQVVELACAQLDWTTLQGEADQFVETLPVDEGSVDNFVGLFSSHQDSVYSDAKDRMYAGIVDVNSSMGPAFDAAKSLLKDRQVIAKDRFERRAKFDNSRIRIELKNTMPAMLAEMVLRNVKLAYDTLDVYKKVKYVEIIAYKEMLDRTFGINVDNALWNIELWQHAANCLAAMRSTVAPRTGDYSFGTGKSVLSSEFGLGNSMSGGMSQALAMIE